MIVSVGEVVWDIFPDGRQILGGAPINVAYHLHTLGVDTGIITKVGQDLLGDRTLARLAEIGLPLDGIQKGTLPTGEVRVSLNENNEPSFDIVAPAAWDDLDLAQAEAYVQDHRFDLVFGTLAQRDPRSREVIRRLVRKAGKTYYDVNLRPPYTSMDLVLESLRMSDIVKCNGDELGEIYGWHESVSRSRREMGAGVLARYDLVALVVTEGEKGAWLVTDTEFVEEPGV